MLPAWVYFHPDTQSVSSKVGLFCVLVDDGNRWITAILMERPEFQYTGWEVN